MRFNELIRMFFLHLMRELAKSDVQHIREYISLYLSDEQ